MCQVVPLLENSVFKVMSLKDCYTFTFLAYRLTGHRNKQIRKYICEDKNLWEDFRVKAEKNYNMQVN